MIIISTQKGAIMTDGNGLFEKMCEDAMDELADGKQTWRELPQNVLMMACFRMMTDRLTKAISKPLWAFTASVSASIIGLIVAAVLTR